MDNKRNKICGSSLGGLRSKAGSLTETEAGPEHFQQKMIEGERLHFVERIILW